MDPWFEPEAARYFAVVALSAFAALATPAIHRGTHRRLVYAVWCTLLALGALLLATGALAYAWGQPRHVIGPLLG